MHERLSQAAQTAAATSDFSSAPRGRAEPQRLSKASFGGGGGRPLLVRANPSCPWFQGLPMDGCKRCGSSGPARARANQRGQELRVWVGPAGVPSINTRDAQLGSAEVQGSCWLV